MTDTETWTLKVHAPRLTDLPAAVRNVCRERGYSCEMDAKKGWLFQTLTFRITGRDLTAFKWSLRETIADYPSMSIVNDEARQP